MLDNLQNSPGSRKARKRIGRGVASGTGKTSGRGHKGYLSRSGSKKRIGFEGGQMPLHIRLPKRGFTNIFKVPFSTVNLSEIESNEKLNKAEVITIEALRSAGLISKKNLQVKVLGDGELKSKVTIEAHRFSASAIEKIEAAGGKAQVIEVEPTQEG